MAIIDINTIKNLPLYQKIIIGLIPSLILIVLFIIFIYLPKKKEIDNLKMVIAKLDNEIASEEVKARKLDDLIAENTMLKAKLAKLQEQLPEEKEVSALLKEISDRSLESGLEILLWKPGSRSVGQGGLYAEIPVQVEVVTPYHNLGIFFSHISRLQRVVNIKNIDLNIKGKQKQESELITANFTALTFAAMSPEERAGTGEKEKKVRKKR